MSPPPQPVATADSVSAAASGGSGGPPLEDLFLVTPRIELQNADNKQRIVLSASSINNNVVFFALVVAPSYDLVLVTSGGDDGESWTTHRVVPWFDDPARRISAIAFDNTTSSSAVLFIGGEDGSVWELNTRRLFQHNHHHQQSNDHDDDDNILRDVCHLNGIHVTSLLVYNPHHQHHPSPTSADDHTTTTTSGGVLLLCTGVGGKFVILANSSPPVVVTFTSPITSTHLYSSSHTSNKPTQTTSTLTTSLLVSLESGQNVTTVLDHIHLPTSSSSSQQTDPPASSVVKNRSLFKKAKDNFLSRMSSNSSSDDKLPKTKPTTTTVKFTTVDDVSCRGNLTPIPNSTLFARHQHNKLDIFDDAFRQTTTLFLSTNALTQVIPISTRVFAGVNDQDHQSTTPVLHLYVIHNATLKEFARVRLPATPTCTSDKILSVVVVPGSPPPLEQFPRSLLVTTSLGGVYELCLVSPPLETCVGLLLSDSPLADPTCLALGVPKSHVCVLAGDTRSREAKFSKTIIYYKLAGLSYASITYKFGSRGQIPAMLFFFELVDQERAKIPYADKTRIAHVALIGRIEQFIRSTTATLQPIGAAASNLSRLLRTNSVFVTSQAVDLLARSPLLLGALKTLTRTRRCEPTTINAIYKHKLILTNAVHTKLYWKLLCGDWMWVWSCGADAFAWFRSTVTQYLPHLTTPVIHTLLTLLHPWRRELSHIMHTTHHKNHNDVIIDFTTNDDDVTSKSAPASDVITLFILVLIEAVARHHHHQQTTTDAPPVLLPSYLTTTTASIHRQRDDHLQQQQPNNKSSSSTQLVSTTMLMLSYAHAFSRSFSASATHCVAVRNGKLFAWGENKLGRLGINNDDNDVTTAAAVNVTTPTPVDLPAQLKIRVSSVATGHTHNVALTHQGTLLVWGSNKYGQLGLPRSTLFVSRPVPLVDSLQQHSVVFTCIAAGSYHSAAIDHTHTLWTWGWGVHGQLGNKHIENLFTPTPLPHIHDAVVYVSCGHSHTAVLTCTGTVLTFGCNHFGQLGLNTKDPKVKTPTPITHLPHHTTIRLVEAGPTATVLVTTKNRLYYAGLNPASLKSILKDARSKNKNTTQPTPTTTTSNNSAAPAAAEEPPTPPQPQQQVDATTTKPHQQQQQQHQDDSAASSSSRDFIEPTPIDTSHIAGDISKVSVGSTHLVLLTSLGYVYTWGLGKSGQLVRPDDDTKTLELIDSTDDNRMIIAADVAAAADTTFIVERDSGSLFACGFNSHGQLGRMESSPIGEDDSGAGSGSSVMTVRTKKRVVRIRQPANIHFKLRHVASGLRPPPPPKNNYYSSQETPPTTTVSQDLLLWTLVQYKNQYHHQLILNKCVEGGVNLSAASLLETLADNHEEALAHQLVLQQQPDPTQHVNTFLNNNKPNTPQATRLLSLLVKTWARRGLPPSSLEDLLNHHRTTTTTTSSWAPHINAAIRSAISEEEDDDHTAQWISANLTPLFILSAISNHTQQQPLPLISTTPSPSSSSSKTTPSSTSTHHILLAQTTSPPTGRK